MKTARRFAHVKAGKTKMSLDRENKILYAIDCDAIVNIMPSGMKKINHRRILL